MSETEPAWDNTRQEAFDKFTMTEAVALMREKGCIVEVHRVYEENPLLDHNQYHFSWPGETELQWPTPHTFKMIAFRVHEGLPCPPIDRAQAQNS